MAQIIKKKVYGEDKLFKIAKNKIDNKYWVYALSAFIYPSWNFYKSFDTPKQARAYVKNIEAEYYIKIGS